jgi:hypothetical protein
MKTGICLLVVFTVWIGSLQARTFKNKEGQEIQASIAGSLRVNGHAHAAPSESGESSPDTTNSKWKHKTG